MSRYKFYDVIDLSKYIITRCTDSDTPITNLQLQHILYLIQKAFLKKDEYAFVEGIEAWSFGPAVPKAYYRFCGYGVMPISERYHVSKIDERDRLLIDRIIEKETKMRPWELLRKVRAEGGAWAQIYNNGKGFRKVIPSGLIKKEGKEYIYGSD